MRLPAIGAIVLPMSAAGYIRPTSVGRECPLTTTATSSSAIGVAAARTVGVDSASARGRLIASVTLPVVPIPEPSHSRGGPDQATRTRQTNAVGRAHGRRPIAAVVAGQGPDAGAAAQPLDHQDAPVDRFGLLEWSKAAKRAALIQKPGLPLAGRPWTTGRRQRGPPSRLRPRGGGGDGRRRADGDFRVGAAAERKWKDVIHLHHVPGAATAPAVPVHVTAAAPSRSQTCRLTAAGMVRRRTWDCDGAAWPCRAPPAFGAEVADRAAVAGRFASTARSCSVSAFTFAGEAVTLCRHGRPLRRLSRIRPGRDLRRRSAGRYDGTFRCRCATMFAVCVLRRRSFVGAARSGPAAGAPAARRAGRIVALDRFLHRARHDLPNVMCGSTCDSSPRLRAASWRRA